MEEASVAGESPDRSKQRESSAEPTPGGGGPVPETRDPRLAVARAAEADTTTKVLSARDVRTEDDARLRAAVAAWVRTGTDEKPAEEDAEPDGTSTADAEVADAAVTHDEAEDAAVTEAEAEDAAEAEAEAEAENAAAEIDGEAETDDEGESGAEDAAGGDSEAENAADAETDAETKAKDEPATGKLADTADEAPEADDDDRDEPAATSTDAETDAETKAKDEPATGKLADTADEAPEADDDDRDEPAAASTETETDAETETKDEPATGKLADAADEAPEADDDDRDEPAAASTETETDEAPEAASGEQPAEPESEPEPATAETATDEDADAETDEPADADGEDAPQGPPAPDNEGRTGDAGASEAPEGEAGDAKDDAPADGDGDNAPQGPVDQPTAVFKAVRPTPQVDQPTTTLKIGGAQRASKFVALKSLDEPAARTPSTTDATALVPQVGPERTTQQPLPPKPPLDLLAELTNTPPPPQTPFRTLVRRIKIWTPLVILLAIIFAVVQSVRPLPQPTLDLTAQDSYTFDGDQVTIPWPSQGQAALDVQGIGSFGSNGTQKPVPIASVAKVMTAYIILRDHPLKSGADGPKIKIDQAAQDQSRAGQESTVDVTAGDSITQREALESILIASANNVARLLARWDAGSEKAFVAKMNATAKDLGMTNTTYTDPSGLTDSTVSTAVDQVKLAKTAMQKPAFREVAAMMSYDDYTGVNHSNWNQLVGHNDVVGIKTGTTTSALGNLVFAAKKDVGGETRTIVGAVLRQPAGGPENTILSAALYGGDQLIRAAQGALKSATIIKKGTVVGSVDDGLGGRTPVIATEDVTAVGWSGLKVKLSFAADDVPHTAKAGTKVGTLTVGDGSGGAVKVPVALQKDLAEPGFTDKLTRLG
ncbi:D-alanyl-D-alanine carboxypeptidase [Streptomyces brasiliensis]|uniref:serine-type D-Ala-D-Ala carboxypeptidase n=1 Tax=Streptomyces brasiliensis TaxID=1954 RepID=A0A917P1R4_9ACTN|nr:D-alanyl-D-alanine carboxypeptidase [Streptomyces brasiliensis]GGJ51788.1 hypothetical protein GCM10010121_073380 [Streptomyces brasiliensis]